jgi:hypothetical protein
VILCRWHLAYHRDDEDSSGIAACPAPNAKRVYLVMKVRGLLLQRNTGEADYRSHEGRIAVDTRNTRWLLRWL